MPNTLLPEKWSTRQLVVSDSVQVDIPAIQEVCDSCSYINQWTGWKPEDHPGMTMENEINYSSIRLVVALKNWPALRFWVKNGFNRIIEMHGDPVFSASSFADFILEKRLVE